MSTLTLTLRGALHHPVDLTSVTPNAFAGRSLYEIEQLSLGALRVCDVFAVSGTPGETVAISGSSSYLDYAGAGLDAGTLVFEGSVGNYAATAMKGGRLDIRGDAGAYLASRQSGGLVTVKGAAGDFAGGTRPGDRFGMVGGIVLVDGNVGERAGERMRRGTIITRGSFGAAAGSRMVGGTLWTEKGFGAGPGPMLRRGTLIGPAVERLLPTFSDCGVHDLNILKILNKYIAETLGALAPRPVPVLVRRYAGDLATLGKGEILLPA
jgi:formylmethanofuran dehydrogenase subunit C